MRIRMVTGAAAAALLAIPLIALARGRGEGRIAFEGNASELRHHRPSLCLGERTDRMAHSTRSDDRDARWRHLPRSGAAGVRASEAIPSGTATLKKAP